jgi:uncharacterized protein involved in exopolysaccharide biosynthesis
MARSSSPELTLHEIWKMLWRRRRIIYGSVGVFLILAILALMASTRRYQSIGEIQVQKASTSSLGLKTDGGDTPSDALEENMVLQTQARILQSDSLALRVINELHLTRRKITRRSGDPGLGLGCSAQRKVRSQGASLEFTTPPQVLKIFHKKLTVKVVDGTRLIDGSIKPRSTVGSSGRQSHVAGPD